MKQGGEFPLIVRGHIYGLRLGGSFFHCSGWQLREFFFGNINEQLVLSPMTYKSLKVVSFFGFEITGLLNNNNNIIPLALRKSGYNE
jgi:hypothetical protein